MKRFIGTSVLFIVLFTFSVQAQINLVALATGFNKPVSISHANDNRLFVVEKDGRIVIVDTIGNLNAGYFLDINSKVNSSGGEQGLLGLAFHPDYASNGYFYVNYTDNSDSTCISRFTVNSLDSQSADVNSETIIMKIHQPFTNHNGGDIKFGPDGYLYIGVGDGGGSGDPFNNAQNPLVLLGKILRIDINQGQAYSIPTTNPFVASPDTLDEIWALGLRNPWRISFDRLSNDFWIADVGQNTEEEINMQLASSQGGENYGWRCYEGNLTFNPSGCGLASDYFYPVFTYPNTGFLNDCSVTGGYVYRGIKYPDFNGHYFYADYCSGKIWSISDSSGTLKNHFYGEFSKSLSTFGEDSKGELYVASLNQGVVYKLESNISSQTQNQKKKNSVISLFPNPVIDQLNFSLTTDFSNNTDLSFTLFDLTGKILISFNLKQKENLDYNFSLNDWNIQPGCYFYQLQKGSEKLAYGKLIFVSK
ncbi:MAG: PQQ-dependent sugar dehydrogenase [Bacteroidetes bacterium]|nr:PQQ-dependent sugar dehydrogenase [Bacteroidota bacterium]HET6244850.1 PQQ-dependent sugar dehydrogenase [Bacteroidia bacterium]